MRMSLDIRTSDGQLDFHIGYVGFTRMRSFFILHYGKDVYEDYNYIFMMIKPSDELDRLFEDLLIKIGDLGILINHSDCDGELTSKECKQLLPYLCVDEDKINQASTVDNNTYYNRIISMMYDFIELVKYCASNDDVKLIFG